MFIKPISINTYHNYSVKDQSSKNMSIPVQISTNSELPRMSFGMCRIDLDKLQRQDTIEQKYLKYNSNNKNALHKLSNESLKEVFEDVMSTEPSMLMDILTARTNTDDGRTVVFDKQDGRIKLINDYAMRLDNGKEILIKAYTRFNSSNEPAVTDLSEEDIKEINKVLDTDSLITIYGNKKSSEANTAFSKMNNKGAMGQVIYALKDRKDELKKLLKDSEGKFITLYGKENTQAFCDVFKNDKAFIREYFMTDGKEKNKVNSLFFIKADAETLNVLFDTLIANGQEDILKEICTKGAGYDNKKLCFAVSNKEAFAKNVLKLIAQSDLPPKNALEVFNANESVIRHNTPIPTQRLERELKILAESDNAAS